MDADEFVGKSIKVTSDPKGIIPKRTKFIASDFAPKLNDVGSTWTSTLKSKVSQIMSSANMKKNFVPGVTAADLVACCNLNLDEAAEVTKFMGEVVTNEKTAFYTVSLIQQSNEQAVQQAQQQQQTQATGTTSTSTTTTSTESSSGSLLVVVAVAAILVLVAVIALVVVTTRSKATADRVVDMRQRTTRQASWQKGGAVDMDF
jgi:cobalamin biosynthesis Mg chelatase CobN